MGRRGKVEALSCVGGLLDFALNYYRQYPQFAISAVRMAQRIAMKHRLRLPPRLKRRFCRKCGMPFIGPSTFSVRVRAGRRRYVVVRCLGCGYVRRYPTHHERLKYRSRRGAPQALT
ncbi:MAG: ribonuclease P [Nitrososphaerota archaeon]